MSFVVPRRFSPRWWLVIGAVTLVVGLAAFLILRFGMALAPEQLVLYCLIATFVGDVVTAVTMEAVAPTRVTIGPGDRRYDADDPAELAVVVSAFDDSRHGRVRIRGETWSARQAASDRTSLYAGAKVRVVDRDGLTLVISADSS